MNSSPDVGRALSLCFFVCVLAGLGDSSTFAQTNFWTGGGTNDYFSNSNNWSLGIVPNLSTDVQLNSTWSSSSRIRLNAPYRVNSIEVNNDALIYGNGSIQTTNDLLINDGELIVTTPNTSLIIGDDLQVYGGFNSGNHNLTLRQSASIDVADDFVAFNNSRVVVDGGRLSVDGSTLLRSGSQLQTSANAHLDSGTVLIYGDLQASGGTIQTSSISVFGSGTAGGLFTVDGSTINSSGIFVSGQMELVDGQVNSATTVRNRGELIIRGGKIDEQITVDAGGYVGITTGALAFTAGDGFALKVTASGRATSGNLHLAGQTTDVSRVDVIGSGAQFNSSGNIFVGSSGRGFVQIRDGGRISSSNVNIGNSVSSVGTVSISGPDSNWLVSSSAFLGGSGGDGTLSITDFGEFRSLGSVFVGGSNFAPEGTGNIMVSTNGALLVDSDLTFWGTSNATVRSSGKIFADALNIEGQISASSSATIQSRDAYVGRYNGGNAIATIDGVGTHWSNSNVLFVGNQGNGTVDVTNGGTITSLYGRIGQLAGSNGVVNLQDTGSSWNVTNSTYLGGFGGHGELHVRDNSSFNSNDSVYVGGNNSGANGTGLVTLASGGSIDLQNRMRIWETGSLLIDGGHLTAGELYVAPGSNFSMTDGSINVDYLSADQFAIDGGVLSVDEMEAYTLTEGLLFTQNDGVLAPGDSPGSTIIDGNYILNGGSIELELGGLLAGTEFDFISTTGDFTINGGTLDVSLIDGFTLANGNDFLFFNIDGSRTGFFDGLGQNSSVGVFDGHRLSIDYFAGDGNDVALYATAIPEPSSAATITLVLALGTLQRRRYGQSKLVRC